MMSEAQALHWYLIRTKSGKERLVRDQLSRMLPEVFLPFLMARVPRWGRTARSVIPLFPCYLFARFDLSTHYFNVKYMMGVQGLVSAGNEPVAVATPIIEQIRERGSNGIVELVEAPLREGARVVVTQGPFCGFEAIFERYLSGRERVAILLGAVESSGVRITLQSSAVARAS